MFPALLSCKYVGHCRLGGGSCCTPITWLKHRDVKRSEDSISSTLSLLVSLSPVALPVCVYHMALFQRQVEDTGDFSPVSYRGPYKSPRFQSTRFPRFQPHKRNSAWEGSGEPVKSLSGSPTSFSLFIFSCLDLYRKCKSYSLVMCSFNTINFLIVFTGWYKGDYTIDMCSFPYVETRTVRPCQ